jgi:hypothetical protein
MTRRIILFSFILTVIFSLTALAQNKAGKRTASNDKAVTVTLVRWPYT